MKSATIWNYIGQLRLYSLADLVLFLWVIGARGSTLASGLALWLAFLCFLEQKHSHHYRAPLPPFTWLPFFAFGIIVYKWYGVIFFILGMLYSKKKRGIFGVISPMFRGAQMVALAVPFVGMEPVVFLSGIISLRNLLGDVRDAGKDAIDGMRTIPVILGLHKNVPYIHLAGIICTTFIWWSWGELPIRALFLVWAVEIATYHLTPR